MATHYSFYQHSQRPILSCSAQCNKKKKVVYRNIYQLENSAGVFVPIYYPPLGFRNIIICNLVFVEDLPTAEELMRAIGPDSTVTFGLCLEAQR